MFTSRQKPSRSGQSTSSAGSVAESTESTSKNEGKSGLTTEPAKASHRVVQPLRNVSILTFYKNLFKDLIL